MNRFWFPLARSTATAPEPISIIATPNDTPFSTHARVRTSLNSLRRTISLITATRTTASTLTATATTAATTLAVTAALLAAMPTPARADVVERPMFKVMGNQASGEAGGVLLGNPAVACDATTEGTIRYVDASNVIEFCDDNTWTTVGPGGTGSLYIDTLLDAYTDYATDHNMRLGSNTALFAGAQYNLFIGEGAGTAGTSIAADDNIAIGYTALDALTEGARNIAIGLNALGSNTTGRSNIAIGRQALQANSTTHDNTGIGSSVLFANVGAGNTAIGSGTMGFNTTGSENSAFGINALIGNTDGSGSVAVGARALAAVTTGGTQNIGVGFQSGDNITTGDNNIIIGYDIDAPSATGNSQLNIGNTIYGDLSTDKVGLGVPVPSYDLSLEGDTAARTIGIERETTAATAGWALTLLAGGAVSGGTDLAGGNLTLSAGTATGAGTSKIIFNAAGYGTSGTADKAPTEVGRITGGGYMQYTGTYGSGDTMLAATGAATLPAGSRMVWYPRKAAFRAGYANGEWNDTNIGDYSVALGGQTIASGTGSTALGVFTTASGLYSTALGRTTIAAGTRSTAMGAYVNVTATADSSMGIGLSSADPATDPQVTGAESFAAFLGNRSGYVMSDNQAFAIIGGRLQLDDDSTNTDKGCIRYNSATDKIQFSHDCTTFTDMGSGGSGSIDSLTDAVYDITTDHNMRLGTNTPMFAGAANNIFIGESAGAAGTSNAADDNLAIGYQALDAVATGYQNIAIGSGVLSAETWGGGNIGIGYRALNISNGGGQNVAVGQNSLLNLVTGDGNVMIGASTASYGSGQDNNVGVGKSALSQVTGDGNIAVGYQAGDAITSGGNNIIIGYDVDAPSATANSQLTIGNLIFATGGFGTGTTVGTGNVGIGDPTPAATLEINGGLITTPSSVVALTADNQLVTVGNRSLVVVSSNATQASRTFCLTTGVGPGQRLLVMQTGGNGSELEDSATPSCAGADVPAELAGGPFPFNSGNILELVWDGATWRETNRSINN